MYVAGQCAALNLQNRFSSFVLAPLEVAAELLYVVFGVVTTGLEALTCLHTKELNASPTLQEAILRLVFPTVSLPGDFNWGYKHAWVVTPQSELPAAVSVRECREVGKVGKVTVQSKEIKWYLATMT